jgi:GxxExxY protein
MGMRLPTTLPPEVEAIVQRIIGAAITVHKQLGPGLRESLYETALRVELKHLGMKVECQRKVTLEYRGQRLPPQWIDMIVEDYVVVELKAIEMLLPVHKGQVISYLRATGLHIVLSWSFVFSCFRVKRRR